MKKLVTILSLCIALNLMSSCDAGFDEINTNKVSPTSLSPDFVLNKAILDATYTQGTDALQMLNYHFGIVQQLITPYGSSLAGANYNQFVAANITQLWQIFYRNVVKQVVDVVEVTRGVESRHNLHQMARIWKAYSFMIITDNHGDIPYTEAGKGYLEEIIAPKYDTQQSIYMDLLKELEEASAALDPSKDRVTTEVLYGGDVVKWKKFGYSLLFRAAMRLSKVDPATAQTFVTKAVAGGLMSSRADDAMTRHSALYNNWVSNHLAAREKTNYYLAEPFVNYLKENNDPRLRIFAVRHVGATSGTEQTVARQSSDPAKQIGMPMGYDDVSIASTFAAKGVVSLWDYTQANFNTVLQLDAPEFHVTYAQTQLLLAEAAHRGWTSGSAATYFENGVRAALAQVGAYGTASVIPPAEIDTYVAAHPLRVGRELEDINTQYWVVCFLSGPESFANFRRSDYPALQKNPYPGSELQGEDFIRRIPYPDSEIVVNQANLNEAIGRQGPNTLSTRVWWDKK
jgi:hypothetical protein